MPIFNVRAPDGSLMKISGPEDATDEELIQIAEQNYKPAPKFKDYLKDIPKAVGRGGAGLLETSAIGASALLPEEYEQAARKGIAGIAKPVQEYLAPSSQQVGESLPSQIASGLGSFLPVAPLGFLGVPGVLTGVGVGLSAGAGEARQAAEQAGATAEQKSQATGLGVIPGGFDAAVDMALAAFPGGAGKAIGVIRRALVSGGIEGATEAAQQIAQNAIAKNVYKPEQDLLTGAAEQGGVGAGVGALASFILDAAIPGRRAGAKYQAPQTIPEVAAAPETEKKAEEAPPLALGMQQPFTPVSLPDGSVAMTQEDLDAYERAQFEKKYQPQPNLNQVAEREEPPLLGYSPLPGILIGTPSGQVALTPEQEFANRYKPQPTEQELQRLAALSQQKEEKPSALAELTQEIPEGPTFKPKAPPKTVPMSEEDAAAVKTYKQDLATVEKKLTEAKKSSTDLYKLLGGKMSYQDVLEVAPEVGNKFKSRDADTAKKVDKYKKLVDPTGKGKSLSSLVADGELNEYLPEDMRLGSPTFDEAESVQYIYDKLASGDTRSFDESQAMKALEEQRAILQELINEPQRRADLNYQAQAAAAEQRGVETLPLGDLIADAQARGVDTDAVMERVAMQMPPDATPAQYQGEVRNQIDNELAAKEGRVAGAPPVEEAFDLSQPQYMKRNATPDQINNAELHAQDFGGRVPYQNGDIGLIQAFNSAGNYVYLPFEGKTRYRKDVDSLESSHFTPKQIKELRDAKAKLVRVEKARKNKLVKFDKNGIGISPDIDDRIVGVVSEWKKMLGIKGNVYITTMDFSRRNAFDYAGPYTKIGAAALDQNNNGIVQKLNNGEYYIAFKEKPSVMRMLETLAHEMGHIHQYEVYDNAPKHLKDMVQKEYEKWLVSQKGKTAQELVMSLRARKAGKETASKVRPDLMASEVSSYWRSFSEWYADQVSRWATTQEKPLNAVEKFFKRIGTALKNFYKMLKGQQYLPTETFKEYLDQVATTAMPDVIESAQDQMPLFMKEMGPQLTQLGADSMEMLEGIGRTVAAPEPGFIEKTAQSWNNARDNPQATREAAYGSFRRFADQVETWAFSSDAGLNNQIRREIMNSMAGQEQKIGMLLNTSLSQTAHSDAVSNLFLMEGNIKYDNDLHKWVGVKDDNNIINLSKKLDDIAEKLGLTKPQVELMAHTAFEARRTQGLNRFNDQIELQAAAMKEQAAQDRAAGRAVAASALNEKANNLLKKKKVTTNMSPEALQTGLKLYDMHPGLKEVTKIWNGIRQNALDRMVETGLYTAEEAEMLMSVADYVPFFREDQIEEGKGPKEFLRSLAVQADKRLKGSSKPVNDIFDNMVRWTQYAINRGVRNRSGLALATTAEQMGLADRVQDTRDGENVVTVWEDGKKTYFSMADPMFVSAFRGLESVSIPTVKFFSKFADVLRQSVVLYPLFSVAQVPQDSFAAMFTSGLKPQHALTIPVRAVKEFIQTLRGKSKAHEELKNVGAVGVRDFTSAIIRADAEIAAGLKEEKGIWGRVKKSLGNLAMAADNAVRQATYEAAMAQGLSRAEAIEKAFEIFNVRRRGNSQMLALAGQVIPFFNAYLAAQHVAYRTLTGVGTSPTEREAAFKTLAATTGSVMALSVLYAMMNGDDDDYLNKPTPTRDRLLMIPGTGGLGIPLRADIFAMPKVLAEHTYLLMTDNGYEDPAKFRASMASLLANSIFSPTPVPQAIKPLAESIMNYDFFQQKPLVGTFQQRKELGRQFEDSTSEFAKVLGSTNMVSPIVADHFIRGMFGSFGGLFLYATNPILAEMAGTPRPALSMQDALATIPNASAFVSKEYEVALRKDFYALKEATDRVGATVSDLKTRSPQELADYLSDEDVRARYALTPAVNQIAQKLTAIRKAVTSISQAPEERMDEDEKQRQIKQLREAELQLLKGVNLKALRERANI